MSRLLHALRQVSKVQLLQAASAALVLTGAIALYGPQSEASLLTPVFVPTITPTSTPTAIHRLPTPTFYLPTETLQPLIHVVQAGEVLSVIAELYETTEEELVAANGMESADDIISIGQEMIIAGAKRIPTSQTTATPSPSATAPSMYTYQAPALLSPIDYAQYSGADAVIVLHWASVGLLKEGEWYEVRVWQPPTDPANATRFRTRSTTCTLPSTLRPSGLSSLLRWQVSVVYAGRTILHASPLSEMRHVRWE